MEPSQGKAEVLYMEQGKPEINHGEVDGSDLKLDKRGLPLVPQPTDRKDDPLVSEALVQGFYCHCFCFPLADRAIELVTYAENIYSLASFVARVSRTHGRCNRQPGIYTAQQRI